MWARRGSKRQSLETVGKREKDKKEQDDIIAQTGSFGSLPSFFLLSLVAVFGISSLQKSRDRGHMYSVLLHILFVIFVGEEGEYGEGIYGGLESKQDRSRERGKDQQVIFAGRYDGVQEPQWLSCER